jgi:hypothetical protein
MRRSYNRLLPYIFRVLPVRCTGKSRDTAELCDGADFKQFLLQQIAQTEGASTYAEPMKGANQEESHYRARMEEPLT